MEKGDLAAVVIGLSLVIVLMVVLSPPPSSGLQPGVVPTTPLQTPTTLPATVPGITPEQTPQIPTPTPFPTKRILYTTNYSHFPVRFLPSDMDMYGFSDIEWQYNSSVAFAYVEENHGGITEPFTVDYPLWRMTTTVTATRTPEKARFRMILVDEQSGLILEGVEIHFPGSVTKTLAARGRPLYMVIAAEHMDEFLITLETPAGFVH
jgi:hypothetical protein